MKISIGSDHAGVVLKALIKSKFAQHEFIDYGPETEDSVDYPDHVYPAAKAVVEGKAERGIVICGTGIGASITANKVNGIRAALCFNGFMAEATRKHNDSNVLVLGARVIGDEVALDIVEKWLNTAFEGGRHQRRIDKLTEIENKESFR